MATVYSAQRTNTRANPTVKNKANELGGRVRIAHGTYEASSLASGDVIELFVLPDGARLISGFMANDAQPRNSRRLSIPARTDAMPRLR